MPAIASLSPRERRTIGIGTIVSAAALLIAFVVVPGERRWSEREALIAAQRGRLARLRSLAAGRSALEQIEREAVAGAMRWPQREFTAHSGALTASAVQTVLQEYADRAQLQVNRLDVAGQPDSSAGMPAIPATLTAVGDISGLADLLAFVQHGQSLFEVTSLAVRSNASLRAPQELLEITLVIRAPFRLE